MLFIFKEDSTRGFLSLFFEDASEGTQRARISSFLPPFLSPSFLLCLPLPFPSWVKRESVSLVLTRNSEPFIKYLRELVIRSSNSHLNEDRKLCIVFLAASELLEGQTINDLMLPWWLRHKESACNAGDLGLIPGLGRCPGVGHGNSLQYSCLKNPCGQMSFAGYSWWDCKELDMTEQLSIAQECMGFHFPHIPSTLLFFIF